MAKQWWLDVAEIIDALRVFPRLLLIGYCAFVWHVTISILAWYKLLPAVERSLEASGLAAAIITAVTGLGSWFLKIYVSTGRDWSGTGETSEAT